jgi:hypothetical protein
MKTLLRLLVVGLCAVSLTASSRLAGVDGPRDGGPAARDSFQGGVR